MYLRKGPGPHVVTLPDGTQMSRADLPPVGTTRWVARDEAIERYDLSDEELAGWEEARNAFGANGLKTTLIQKFRQS